jgi:L-cysteine S-thiosulfotransferase
MILNTTFKRALLAAAVAAFAGCASTASTDYDALATQMMKASFSDKGIATVERLNQDTSNRECSQAEGRPLPEARAKAIEAENLKTIQWPSDGRFIGDWRAGEKIAQSGRGMTWTDTTTSGNGGNCYACHQLSKSEIAFGTIGPSLYRYGVNRGVSDPASPSAKAVVDYTWGKLWNSKAYNACSNMPRAGHSGILTEAQIRDVMALLLDPKSPVNQ